MKIIKDVSLIISNGSTVALARRDEQSKRVVFYELKEADLDYIEKLLNKHYEGNDKRISDSDVNTDSGV